MTETLLPTKGISVDLAESAVADPRFVERVLHMEDPCQLWLGECTEKGYGRYVVEAGARYRAHRLAWVAATGQDIPAGMTIDHICLNPACVNPNHMEVVSVNENVRRQNRRNRGRGRRKLSEADVQAIRADSRPRLELAMIYAVSVDHISRIRSRRSWPHVDGDLTTDGHSAQPPLSGVPAALPPPG